MLSMTIELMSYILLVNSLLARVVLEQGEEPVGRSGREKETTAGFQSS